MKGNRVREESKERAMGNFKRGERNRDEITQKYVLEINSKVLKHFMWIFHITMEL